MIIDENGRKIYDCEDKLEALCDMRVILEEDITRAEPSDDTINHQLHIMEVLDQMIKDQEQLIKLLYEGEDKYPDNTTI